MIRIALLDAFAADQGDPRAWDGLAALGQIIRRERTAPQDVEAACAGAEAIITNKVAIGRDLLARLPWVRYIGVSATGTDAIDVAAAAARGVAVTNVPGYSTAAVAQATIALLLDICNGTAEHAQAVRQGDWSRSPDFCMLRRPVRELAGATIVLVGTGAIGSAVGRIATAMGMRVLAAQVPGRPPSPERLPLEEALPQADVVSLHCPQTPATRGLLGSRTLRLCRDDAIILNTARGGLIEEPALLAWLAAHPRARAGLDVLDGEPPGAGHPLCDHPQVVVTPHIGWAADAARARLRAEVAANLAAWQRGERRNRVDAAG
jgi:glycerate dehydrogenase